MDSLIGYSLKDALAKLDNKNKIINIRKVVGTNKKFNNLDSPYVIKECLSDTVVTLYISYY